MNTGLLTSKACAQVPDWNRREEWQERKGLPSGRIHCEPVSVVRQRPRFPQRAAQGSTARPDTECCSHSITREIQIRTWWKDLPPLPTGSAPNAKAPNSTVPTLDTLLHPSDAYQPACVLKFLWVRMGPWGLSQILHCTACLEKDGT